jgi:hypothetical protein
LVYIHIYSSDHFNPNYDHFDLYFLVMLSGVLSFKTPYDAYVNDESN